MQSYWKLTNFIWIATVLSMVSGYPFSFLPRYSDDQGGLGTQTIGEPSNFLTPLSEYNGLAEEEKPVKPWVKITQGPVNGIDTTVGSRVELECRGNGSPPPEILWFTGSGTNEQLIDYVKANAMKYYNPAQEWKGVAKTNSKLVLDCVTPQDAGLIYCAAVSGKEVKVSNPTVLVVKGDHGNSNCSSESSPIITLYSPTRVANIGSTVILPCRATGKPMPQISWVDNFNMPLSLSTNPRHRVLNNGDLLIENLLWEDMGGFVCTARIGHLRETISTFLYPLRADADADRTVN